MFHTCAVAGGWHGLVLGARTCPECVATGAPMYENPNPIPAPRCPESPTQPESSRVGSTPAHSWPTYCLVWDANARAAAQRRNHRERGCCPQSMMQRSTRLTSQSGRKLELGVYHICALLSDEPSVLGRQRPGRTGGRHHGRPDHSTWAVVYLGSWLTGVTKLSTGNTHTCAVLTDGTIRCWGDNAYGMLGDGTTGFFRTTPVTVCQHQQRC